MKRNIKPATIARIGALIVALVNECLVMFGRDILPFTENMVYQVISLVAVIIISAINAWYNNDISKIALLCGRVFDSLSDGKISEEEIEDMLAKTEDEKNDEETNNSNAIITFVNDIIKGIKSKFAKK